MVHKLALAAGVLGGILASGAAVQAAIIYDNLSSGNGANGAIINNYKIAGSFTTGAQASTLTSVKVKAAPYDGNVGGFQVTVCANAAGNVPASAPLITLIGTDKPTNLSTYTGTLALAANTTYWVTLATTSGYRYQYDLADSVPTIGSGLGTKKSFNGGSTWSNDFNLLMQVQATVPEPTSAMLLLSLGGLGLLRRGRVNR